MRILLVATAAWLAAGCATGPATVAPPGASTHAAASIERANNVIFLVGAGMGINTLTAARIYSVGEAGELAIDKLPESAFVKTWSRDSQVTDGAAAMSAYMTGVKADNGVVSMAACAPAPVRPAATLAELARAQGRAVGLVTTSRVTDATPAAVYAHICARAHENDIAASLADSRLDVVLGGGTKAFLPAASGGTRTDGRDLLLDMRRQGTRILTDTTQLARLVPQVNLPVLGLFAPGDMDVDAERDAARQPGLAEMTKSAIAVLSARPNGFFLVVEGGGIDRALHASRAKRALQETVAFNGALQTAIDQMQLVDPGLKNTLIVATADHDSTLVINGYSPRTGATSATNPGVLGLVRNVGDNRLRLDQDGMPYPILGFGNGEHRIDGSRASAPALTDTATSADGYRQEAAIRMPPGAATNSGNDVYLGAIGAGADTFYGTIDNTRVFGLIRAATGW